MQLPQGDRGSNENFCAMLKVVDKLVCTLYCIKDKGKERKKMATANLLKGNILFLNVNFIHLRECDSKES